MNLLDVASRTVAKKWIAGAIKHPGSFSAAAKKAGKSTSEFAHEHESDSGTTGKRARLALTLMGMHHKGGDRAKHKMYKD